MTPTRSGSFKLFTLARISVYVHWLWFVVAYFMIRYRGREYSSVVWKVLEYLSLFLIVLLHEFGHQLACRQVGGRTHDIILWPLGGVAYVSPPERPGAQLWSIAAGPLVNVALTPVLLMAALISAQFGWPAAFPDFHGFLRNILLINIVLLIFNLLPIYPLDGGQILRSLLWFVFGRANSLLAASVIGFIGVTGLFLLALIERSVWVGIMAGFILINCWQGLNQARILARVAKLPRRDGFACPSCNTAPPLGEYWRCAKCGNGFDMFITNTICPNCQTLFNSVRCLDCGVSRSLSEWVITPPIHC